MSSTAFAHALHPHYNDVVSYCRMLCASQRAEDADDVLQQALLQALEHFDELNDVRKFRQWLFRIVLNSFRMSRRRRFWNRFIPLDLAQDVERMPPVLRNHEYSEASLILQDALSGLSDREREAILLFELAGFQIAEIQDLQGDASISAVKSRLSRARLKMARILSETGGGSGKLSPLKPHDVTQETIRLVERIESKGRDDE